jgi:hypothetical protein
MKLTQKRALELATKTFGKTAAVQERPEHTSEEGRRWASAERKRFPKPVAPDINAWPEDATVGDFRKAVAKHRKEFAKWKKRDEELMVQALRYRCCIYVLRDVGGMTFSTLKGEGDTWEAALEKAGVKGAARTPTQTPGANLERSARMSGDPSL